nr:hypothetical protein CFP56_28506 [Quercus suber]
MPKPPVAPFRFNPIAATIIECRDILTPDQIQLRLRTRKTPSTEAASARALQDDPEPGVHERRHGSVRRLLLRRPSARERGHWHVRRWAQTRRPAG